MLLNDVMQAIGYKGNHRGLCFGVAHVAKQATLLGEDQELIELLSSALHWDKTDLQSRIAFSRAIRVTDLGYNPIKKLDILLWKIDQYQNSRSDVSNLIFYLFQNAQHTESTIQDILDDRLKAQGGLVSEDFCGIYTEEELKKYFRSLELILENLSHPVAIILESLNHAIELSFRPQEKKWRIVSGDEVMGITAEIAQVVSKIFGIDDDTSFAKPVALTTSVYAVGNYQQSLADMMMRWKLTQDWMDLHEPTQEKAKQVGAYQSTWLHTAAKMGDVEGVKALLAAGASPHVRCSNGSTPIAYGIFAGKVDLIEVFKGYQSLDERSSSFGSPLHNAASLPDFAMVETLLEHGANPNLLDDGGYTPLYHACLKGVGQSVQLLLAHQACADITFPDNTSLLVVALFRQDWQILELLLNKLNTPASDAILTCIIFKLDQSLKYLLQRCGNSIPELPCTDEVLASINSPDKQLAEGIARRKKLFLESQVSSISLYQITCILGYGNMISCFIQAGLGPDLSHHTIYQKLQAYIQQHTSQRFSAPGDGQEQLQAAKDLRFLYLCFGAIRKDQIPDAAKAGELALLLDLESAETSNPMPILTGSDSESADASSSLLPPPMRIVHNYPYGHSASKRFFFHAMSVQAPTEGLSFEYQIDGQTIKLGIINANSILKGDALKREILDRVMIHINDILLGQYGEPNAVMAAFQDAFKLSTAFALLEQSQGLVTAFVNLMGSCWGRKYPTDSILALDAMFSQVNEGDYQNCYNYL